MVDSSCLSIHPPMGIWVFPLFGSCESCCCGHGCAGFLCDMNFHFSWVDTYAQNRCIMETLSDLTDGLPASTAAALFQVPTSLCVGSDLAPGLQLIAFPSACAPSTGQSPPMLHSPAFQSPPVPATAASSSSPHVPSSLPQCLPGLPPCSALLARSQPLAALTSLSRVGVSMP